MARQIKKYKVELNSPENLRDLLQATIELADEQLVQAQDEINKLKNATRLTEETMDGKARYARAINDYLALKDRAVSRKIEVAKILNEVMNRKGVIDDVVDNPGKGGFNIAKLQEMVDDVMTKKDGNPAKTLVLKKP